MLVLYDLPISSYGCKTRILLRHKGLDWTSLAPPDGYGSPAYCKIVPSGTIPALVHDGFTLGESDAIAEYLNELAPEPAMLPETIKERAKARALSRFHDTRIEPLLRAYFGQVTPASRNADFIAENAALLQRDDIVHLDRTHWLRNPMPNKFPYRLDSPPIQSLT